MSASSENNSRSKIRLSMRNKRRELSIGDQRQHAIQLSSLISRSKTFRFNKNIAIYLANDGEIETFPLIQTAWNMGKNVYLPVLSPLKNQLYFSLYTPETKMRFNRFGIEEPDSTPDKWLSAQQLSVIYLPLVAFDEKGNRLGMGGGFYDRSLAYLSNRTALKKPRLIGLAHEIQQQEKLDNEKWDIPLSAIATEKRIIDCK